MSVFIDDTTRVLVQGITGEHGRFHTERMQAAGTEVVAGVVPGKAGERVHGVPVYETVRIAMQHHDINASVIFVPPAVATDAIMEAIDAALELVVVVSEGIPMQDMATIRRRLGETDTRLVGPNSPGIIAPDQALLGIIPTTITRPGRVGLVSRSGTLTYQIIDDLTRRGIGQSTALGIGGDPIVGTTFREALPAFETDPDTDVVVLCGEIGGAAEETAAEYIATMETPVVGFVAGRTAPTGTRMGHAGAIVTGEGTGTADSKITALRDAGAYVEATPSTVVERVVELVG